MSSRHQSEVVVITVASAGLGRGTAPLGIAERASACWRVALSQALPATIVLSALMLKQAMDLMPQLTPMISRL